MAKASIGVDEAIVAEDMAVDMAGDMMVEMADDHGILGKDGSSSNRETVAEDTKVRDGQIQLGMIATTSRREAMMVASGRHRGVITIVLVTEQDILAKILNASTCPIRRLHTCILVETGLTSLPKAQANDQAFVC